MNEGQQNTTQKIKDWAAGTPQSNNNIKKTKQKTKIITSTVYSGSNWVDNPYHKPTIQNFTSEGNNNRYTIIQVPSMRRKTIP
jgi:hypothetical protein